MDDKLIIQANWTLEKNLPHLFSFLSVVVTFVLFVLSLWNTDDFFLL